MNIARKVNFSEGRMSGNDLMHKRLLSELDLMIGMAELSAYFKNNADYKRDAIDWLDRWQREYSSIFASNRKTKLEIKAVREVLPKVRELMEFAFQYPYGISKLKEVHFELRRALNSY